MSIVEKAIAKLQSASGFGAPDAKPIQPHVPAPSPEAQISRPDEAPLPTAAAVTIDLQTLQSAGMLPPQNGALLVRNQFRRLKWSLLDEIEAARGKGLPHAGAFMVTSALPDEGKTFVSINLALSLAREENFRVILVDGDVAKGHVSDLFGVRERLGLMELLTEPNLRLTDTLVRTSIDRLYLLPAGKFRPNAVELMSGGKLGALMNELLGGNGRRIVVFDCSPVLATNAAQILARTLPQVLLVVRAENTAQSAVLEAVDLLDRAKVMAVLNQAHITATGENYNQSYGYYGNEEL